MGQRLDAEVKYSLICAVVVIYLDRIVIQDHSHIRPADNDLPGKVHPETDLLTAHPAGLMRPDITAQNVAEPIISLTPLLIRHRSHLQISVLPFVNKIRVVVIFLPVFLLGDRQTFI